MAGVNKTLSLFLIGLIPFFSTMGSTYSADSENQKTGKGTSVEERLAHVFAKRKFNVNLRYRYEFVDQDGLNRNAHANTLRARIGYTTGTFYGFSAKAEGEAIAPIGHEFFNSTTNGSSTFPTVADPEELEVNQLWLRYSNIPKTVITGGRQRIIFDNARFVGNVGWRQNEQTFDAAQINFKGVPDTKLTYVYLWKVNRIFGDDSLNGNFRMSSHLVNAAYNGFKKYGKLTAYAYLLDFTRRTQSANSTQTYGLRFKGDHKITDKAKLLYTLEGAHQRDFSDNTNNINQNYYTGELGIHFPKVFDKVSVTGKIGYEVLEGDGNRAFQTPLATLHAFNGWTDKFLSTPSDGIEDLYFALGLKLYGVNILGVYHDFDANNTSADYGNEWGINISRKFFKRFSAGVKYANYGAEDFATDTQKLWLTLQFDY